MEKKYVKKKEKLSFSAAAFGRSAMYTLISMFVLRFYTDAVGISPLHAGYIILGGQIFDALNDPIMGMLVDRTRTKWGKLRPYMLFTPIPIAIASIILFCAPDFGTYSAKVAFAAFSYILWGIVFTIQDVPFWGLSSVLTPNEEERTSIIANARLGSTLGSFMPTLLVPILISLDGVDIKQGFFIAAVILGVGGAALSSLAFFGTKERIVQSENTPSIKELGKNLLKNKVLIIVVISSVIGATISMTDVASSYLYDYLITDSGIVPRGLVLPVLMVALGLGMIPSMILIPILRKQISLKWIYIGACGIGVLAHIFIWAVGYSNYYLLLLGFVLIGIPQGVFNVITYALIADSVDYIEWKTGKRNEGVSFAFQTFISKAKGGIVAFAMGLVLTITQFIEPINGVIQPQMSSVKNGMFFAITFLPIIGYILTAVPMFFNTYTGKIKEEAQKELIEIRQRAGK